MRRVRRRVTIEGLYYAHGLLCASYPITTLSFVFVIVVVCSLPFFVTPNGDLNTPKPWRSPWLNYRVPAGKGGGALGEGMEWIVDNSTQFSGRVPSWFRGLPVALAQQLYVTVKVNCSTHHTHCQRSHFSSSKAVSATLLHTLEEKTRSCYSVLHPAAISLTSELDHTHPPGVLSPLLDTVLSHWESDQNVLGFQTTKELLYGGLWQKEHSSSPSPSSSPTIKTHMFSITLLLDVTVARFSSLTHCMEAIKRVWPVEVEATPLDARASFIKHFYYEPEWSVVEFLPLLSVYFIVFLYISFSVGKIDLVKSKIGLGVAAIITLVCSLTMSLGICTFFGLSISLSSSEVYPFFVIVLGLENILIIVKAVMSTPEEFEVKQRIAAGLSKEGRAISRNLGTLLLMLSMGIVFLNYTMKEFCIIGLVALLCDTYLQLFFFPTVLSIDLRRLELSDLGSDAVGVAMQQATEGTPSSVSSQGPCPTSLHITPPSRWRSKRVKFAYFLASARLVSRAIMVALVVSIMIVWAAKTDKLQKLLGFNFILPPPTSVPPSPLSQHKGEGPVPLTDGEIPYQFDDNNEHSNEPASKVFSKWDKSSDDVTELLKEGVAKRSEEINGWSVMCESGEMCWRAMVTTYWPKLLGYYGYTVANRFLTVLPPIMLNFDLGINSTHSSDSTHKDHTHLYNRMIFLFSHPYFTKGSVMTIFICVVMCYCVWLVRSTIKRLDISVGRTGGEKEGPEGKGHLRSSNLKGHTQDIECLCVSDDRLVSASLDGDIRVWNTDSMTRGCALVISRSEQCGDLLTYADKCRPDADGCEADNKSVRSLQMMPTTISPIGGPVNFYSGGPPSHTTHASPLTTAVGVTASHDPVLYQVTSSSTNQMASTNQIMSSSTNQAAVSQHIPLGRSMSVQNFQQIGERRQFIKPAPLPTISPQTAYMTHMSSSNVQPVSPTSPPSSPLPTISPQTPYMTHMSSSNVQPVSPTSPPSSPPFTSHKARRHSTHSLQEHLTIPHSPAHTSLTPHSPNIVTHHSTTLQPNSTLPLCGLPTSPPNLTPTHSIPHSMDAGGVSPTSSPVDGPSSWTIGGEYITSYQTEPRYVTSQKGVNDGYTPRRGHTRSKSSGPLAIYPSPSQYDNSSTTVGTATHKRRHRTHSRNHSLGNIGRNGGTDFKDTPELSRSSVSICSKFPPTKSSKSPPPPPNPEKGYDFAKHFNLFSPFTSNMALEFSRVSEGGDEDWSTRSEVNETPPPAVWSMDVWNNSIAVGCGNGQIEVWNMNTGSLTFALSTNLAGATVISISSHGIVSGHMDGYLHVVGLDGYRRHTLSAHIKPISVLRCTGGRIVSGGYDGMIVIHRMADLERERTITVHNGHNVTSLAIDTTVAMCVSGCGGGVVCYWEIVTGNCRHVLQEAGGEGDDEYTGLVMDVAVVKLDILVGGAVVGGAIVGLMSDETVVVWDKATGENLYTITLDGMCQEFALLGDRYMAACVESSVITMYDLESGQKRFHIAVEGGDRGVVLASHLLPLHGTHVVCSTGRDIQIIHCNVKLKVD